MPLLIQSLLDSLVASEPVRNPPPSPLAVDPDQGMMRNIMQIICPTVTGPWIAGGAALKWYTDSPVNLSDIDVFFRDSGQHQKLFDALTSNSSWTLKMRTRNASTWNNRNTNHVIQLIEKEFFEDIQSLLDSFDITVCQIATDGERFYASDQTYEDIQNRSLRMHLPLQPNAIRRYFKYVAYGYRPVPGLHAQVCNDPDVNWNMSIDDYDTM